MCNIPADAVAVRRMTAGRTWEFSKVSSSVRQSVSFSTYFSICSVGGSGPEEAADVNHATARRGGKKDKSDSRKQTASGPNNMFFCLYRKIIEVMFKMSVGEKKFYFYGAKKLFSSLKQKLFYFRLLKSLDREKYFFFSNLAPKC